MKEKGEEGMYDKSLTAFPEKIVFTSGPWRVGGRGSERGKGKKEKGGTRRGECAKTKKTKGAWVKTTFSLGVGSES